MKIEKYTFPKSSFLSLDKDMALISNYIVRNTRLKKLLYYTSKDALTKPSLTEDETLSLFGRNIKNIPKLSIDSNALNYLLINFDNFTPNATNPHFRDNVIEFDIICHYDQWELPDFQLRPYRIAAEIDTMFNGQHLTGIGKLDFFGCKLLLLTEEYAGLSLRYRAIHGGEDTKGMPNPQDEDQFLKDFDEIFNSGG